MSVHDVHGWLLGSRSCQGRQLLVLVPRLSRGGGTPPMPRGMGPIQEVTQHQGVLAGPGGEGQACHRHRLQLARASGHRAAPGPGGTLSGARPPGGASQCRAARGRPTPAPAQPRCLVVGPSPGGASRSSCTSALPSAGPGCADWHQPQTASPQLTPQTITLAMQRNRPIIGTGRWLGQVPGGEPVGGVEWESTELRFLIPAAITQNSLMITLHQAVLKEGRSASLKAVRRCLAMKRQRWRQCRRGGSRRRRAGQGWQWRRAATLGSAERQRARGSSSCGSRRRLLRC